MNRGGKRCSARHCRYQPEDEHFCCPRCGARAGHFCIDESFGDDDCTLIHPMDAIICTRCGYSTTGQRFCNAIQRKLSMVVCVHCAGTGYTRRDA